MEDFLQQVQDSLDNDLYYLALFVSLTVPDICGAIESENGKATPEKYQKWFDKYVADKYQGVLSGKECYVFRCSLLHQGSSQHPRSEFSRVLFVEPSATTHVLHNNIINGALNIDVRIFCSDIIMGARTWLQEHEDSDCFIKNYDKFMRRYPKGLPPYIVGVPVIS